MLTGIQSESLTAMISVKEYFSFALGMSLALGAVFELPIAVLALTAIGLVTPAMLNKFRRHAAVLCLVGSAFITPGADPFSLIALAVPLYALFELSIGVSTFVHRRRVRRQAANEQSRQGQRVMRWWSVVLAGALGLGSPRPVRRRSGAIPRSVETRCAHRATPCAAIRRSPAIRWAADSGPARPARAGQMDRDRLEMQR